MWEKLPVSRTHQESLCLYPVDTHPDPGWRLSFTCHQFSVRGQTLAWLICERHRLSGTLFSTKSCSCVKRYNMVWFADFVDFWNLNVVEGPFSGNDHNCFPRHSSNIKIKQLNVTSYYNEVRSQPFTHHLWVSSQLVSWSIRTDQRWVEFPKDVLKQDFPNYY